MDLTEWTGERWGGWTFLEKGWGRSSTAVVLGVAGAIVEALGESTGCSVRLFGTWRADF